MISYNLLLTKCIIHESDVTWASRRLKLPVIRLFVQKIQAKMKQKLKQRITDPF